MVGSTEDKKKMHWKKWSFLCRPKELRGLNFRNFTDFNQALVAKQIWRIINHLDALIARVLKSIYFSDTSVMEADMGANPSYMWKSLLRGRELIKLGLRYRIGNGKTIIIFEDPEL